MAKAEFHIVNRIRNQVATLAGRTAVRFQRDGSWMSLTWAEFGAKIDRVSRAMLAMGLERHDTVAIYAANSARWSIADIAALQIRCVTVPVYATNTAGQTAYVINDAGVKVLFAGNQQQYDAAISLFEQCPTLQRVVAMEADIDLRGNPHACHWDQFCEFGSEFSQLELDTRIGEASLDDLMTLIYTSGTTGEPKGVMLDYANFAAQIDVHNQMVELDGNDTSLAFLPLSHVFERAWSFYVLHRGAVNVYLSDTNQVREAMAEIKPTHMCAVPRFYEKIYAAVHDKVSRAPKMRQKLFHWAVRMGMERLSLRQAKKPVPMHLEARYKLADKLVLTKLRGLLGGNIKMMPCGGAKLDPEIGRFFHAIGLNVKLGYGMTETVATISCWDDLYFDYKSIGRPIPGSEIRIGEQNEIQVRGPMVMRGYYNKPEETAATFTEDGFLHTGDVGEYDENGNLFITDRLKELMKTSCGKYIAPQVIETTVGKDHLIEHIAVVADARKFVSALVVPCFESLEATARELNIAYHDRLDLLRHSQIVELFEKRIADLQKELAKFEQIKKFTLLPKAFSMDEGELTPTLKLRRKVITERYKKQIDDMYH